MELERQKPGTAVVPFVQNQLTPVDVLAQVQTIQELMSKVMHDGEHYGTIPGTDKPTLLKAGAEKLSILFRLAPDYEVERGDLPGGHREYHVTCRLKHIHTTDFWGAGVGICSTMESKYRWRQDVEWTGEAVPQDYWKDRDATFLGGKGFMAKKNPGSGQWEIAKKSGRVENQDIADTYNTVLKMAKKRAHVDAMLTATAASDIFTQDLADEPESNGKPGLSGDGSNGDLQKAIEQLGKQTTLQALNREVRRWPGFHNNPDFQAAAKEIESNIKAAAGVE
jgi:hypothetical protein